jgi:excisionase family DNA binding protein
LYAVLARAVNTHKMQRSENATRKTTGMEKENDGDLTCSVFPEAAAMIGCGRNKAYDLAASGWLPVVKVGRKIRVLKGPLRRKLGVETT